MGQETETAKRELKDSVFVLLFKDKKYILQLYRGLYPKDTEATEDDIIVNTLESVFVNTLYNDLSFAVRDKLIFFVEAQSVWDRNITFRLLLYIAETYKRYLHDSGQDLHGKAVLKIPKPAVYIVYTGNEKSVPETASLCDEFFNGDSPVEVKAAVLRSEDRETIHGQYIGFCKVFNEQRKLYGNSKKCIEETIRICLEKGYLIGFIESHESEVFTVFDELFSIDRSWDLNEKRIRKEAKAEGRAEGNIENAKKMLSLKKFSHEDIIEITGLSKSKINELEKQIKAEQTAEHSS